MNQKIESISEVFTPNDTPTISYVGRKDLKLEENLKSYLTLPKMVISISGPSKSGKTVLTKRVLDDDNVIPVIGSGIVSPEDLWDRTLQWMEVPTSKTNTTSSGSHIGGGAKGGGEVGLPLVAKGKAEATVEAGKMWSESNSETNVDGGLSRVIKEVGNSDFVIFIDDFHYIDEQIREEIGRQIKVAADNGVKIITASVPHRSDDVVRSNPELRGRVAAVDLGYWEKRHLKMIAQRGFDALECELAPAIENRLAEEAMGSPQLMQTICFCLCHTVGISRPLQEKRRLDISEENLQAALLHTSHFTDFSTMLSSLHSGPRSRGQERKVQALSIHRKGMFIEPCYWQCA